MILNQLAAGPAAPCQSSLVWGKKIVDEILDITYIIQESILTVIDTKRNLI